MPLPRIFRGRAATLSDIGLAAGFSALVLIELRAHWDDGYSHGPAALNVPLLLIVTGCLAVRRHRPLLANVVAFGAVSVPSLFVAHTLFFFGSLLPLALLVYSIARHVAWPRAAVGIAAPVVLVATYQIHTPFDAGDYLFSLVLFGVAYGAGVLVRRLHEQRAVLADVLHAQLHDQQSREAALIEDERGRIAREMHDIVAHAVSLMVVQAGAARLAVGADDDEARAGMAAVESAGRQALVDLRRLLGVLRPDAGEPSAAPMPGLGSLAELAERMRGAGLDVRLTVSGAPRPLPAGLDLTAYRIVQEALTNTLKHAGPTRVDVQIDYGPELAVVVRDGGPAPGRPPSTGTGARRGLVGIRERTLLFGGTVDARRDGPGWAVRVRLPLPDDAPTGIRT